MHGSSEMLRQAVSGVGWPAFDPDQGKPDCAAADGFESWEPRAHAGAGGLRKPPKALQELISKRRPQWMCNYKMNSIAHRSGEG